MSKSPQGAIDRILSELNEDDRAEFLNNCRFNPTYSDLQSRLRDLGHQVSISAIQRWYLRSFPVGDEARMVNGIMTQYQGVDNVSALSMSLAVTTKLVDSLLQLLGADELETLRQKPQSIAYQLGILLKEMRVTAQTMQQMTTIRDRKSLELAGGYRLAELIKSSMESDPNYALIEAAVHAAILQLEDEVNRA